MAKVYYFGGGKKGNRRTTLRAMWILRGGKGDNSKHHKDMLLLADHVYGYQRRNP